MRTYVLDTSALLTLRDDEPGSDVVADVLEHGRSGEARCLVSFMSLMELLYCVWRTEGAQEGRLAYRHCLALPVEIAHENRELLETAAELKATHRLSVADAWIAATALLAEATLVHRDPEFAPLPVLQTRLPPA